MLGEYEKYKPIDHFWLQNTKEDEYLVDTSVDEKLY
jgi:hypothetical protein